METFIFEVIRMAAEPETIDLMANIFSQAIKKTLEKSTKKTIRYSTTFQSVPRVSLQPEIGCFVLFSGDYSGLVVMNFSAAAAMEGCQQMQAVMMIRRSSMGYPLRRGALAGLHVFWRISTVSRINLKNERFAPAGLGIKVWARAGAPA